MQKGSISNFFNEGNDQLVNSLEVYLHLLMSEGGNTYIENEMECEWLGSNTLPNAVFPTTKKSFSSRGQKQSNDDMPAIECLI